MAIICDAKDRLNEPGVRALLALSVGSPTEDRLDRLCEEYVTSPDREIIGWVDGEQVLGLLGYRRDGPVMTLTHLATDPYHRQRGIGRGMINAVSGSLELETHADAIEFYRRCGFTVQSLGEKYPGVERFRCTRPG